jgi:hypothetical protein
MFYLYNIFFFNILEHFMRPAAQDASKSNEHGTKIRPRLMYDGLGVSGVCTKTSCHKFCIARVESDRGRTLSRVRACARRRWKMGARGANRTGALTRTHLAGPHC